ncbi:MAG: hypothetical protein KGJ93_00085 [Patescibacteria group bacterium]|nr:hypothetical protein [Patescibacteria group bacterium]
MSEEFDRKAAVAASLEQHLSKLKQPDAQADLSVPRISPTPEVERPKSFIPDDPEERRILAEKRESELKAAREAYVKTKRDLGKFGVIKSVWEALKGKDTKEKVRLEHEKAQKEYDKKKAEYYKVATAQFLQERDKLLEEEIKNQAPGKRWPKKAYDWYKGLSNKNLALFVERVRGKKIENRYVKAGLGMVNPRTAISLGLLGGGVYFGATAAGVGIFTARRLVSGTSASVGTYDLLNLARGGRDRVKLAKEIDKIETLDEVEQRMARIEARVMFDGKTYETLQGDRLYQQLKSKRAEIYEKKTAEQDTAWKLSQFIGERSKKDEEQIEKSLGKEKNFRRLATATGAAVGAVIGTGKLNWLYRKLMPEHASAAAPKGLAGHPEAPAEFKPAMPPVQDIQLHAGSRGIEGALLDLKKTNAESYNKMLAWMQNQPGIGQDTAGHQITDPGKLVHRFVDKFAQEHNFNIDQGGGHDLSRMFKADMAVHADGSVTFNTSPEHFQFMPESHHAATAGQPDLHHGDLSSLTPEEIQKMAHDQMHDYLVQHPQETAELKRLLNPIQPDIAPPTHAVPAPPKLPDSGIAFPRMHEPPVDLPPHQDYGFGGYDAPVHAAARPEIASAAGEVLLAKATAAKDTAKALKQILPKDQLHNFMHKVLGVSDRKLNGLKNMSVLEFAEKAEVNKKFQNEFSKLGKLIFEKSTQADWDSAENLSVRQWLVNYALRIKK